MTRGFKEEEHTADVALEFWAEDERGLLLEGARALMVQITEGEPLPEDAPHEFRDVDLTALDPPDRLVRWLNELLFWAVTEGFIFVDADLSMERTGQVFGARLSGRVFGVRAPEAVRTELKSVTYHDLKLSADEAGARARVVIDV